MTIYEGWCFIYRCEQERKRWLNDKKIDCIIETGSFHLSWLGLSGILHLDSDMG